MFGTLEIAYQSVANNYTGMRTMSNSFLYTVVLAAKDAALILRAYTKSLPKGLSDRAGLSSESELAKLWLCRRTAANPRPDLCAHCQTARRFKRTRLATFLLESCSQMTFQSRAVSLVCAQLERYWPRGLMCSHL